LLIRSRTAGTDPLRKFGSGFSMTGVGPERTFGLPIDNLRRDLQTLGPMRFITLHCQTGVRKAEPHESRVQWLAINRRNTEAIDAMALSSRTRRNPKLLGGLPTAQPPALASRTKSVT
jgi:hypothetical protein